VVDPITLGGVPGGALVHPRAASPTADIGIPCPRRGNASCERDNGDGEGYWWQVGGTSGPYSVLGTDIWSSRRGSASARYTACRSFCGWLKSYVSVGSCGQRCVAGLGDLTWNSRAKTHHSNCRSLQTSCWSSPGHRAIPIQDPFLRHRSRPPSTAAYARPTRHSMMLPILLRPSLPSSSGPVVVNWLRTMNFRKMTAHSWLVLS
jgi:hypothetical protein